MRHTRPSSPSEKDWGERALLDSEDRFLLAIAADRPDLLPNALSDIDHLTKRIREHRLEGRCRRLSHELRARGYHESLFSSVDVLCEATHRAYVRNREAAEALCSRMEPGFGVVIKGFSTYLLTGDPATLRCGDIDLIVADSIPITEYLLHSGFRQTRTQFLHEIGEFYRDGTEFDLQWGFPVSRYPDGLNDGEWRVCGGDLMRAEYVTAEFACECSAGASGRIRVPTPELAVLIAAAHAFMNFSNIWSISHRGKAWLRLAEFADILDLQSDADFSPVLFRELAVRFHAQDVLSWAESIWRRLSGSTLFPTLNIQHSDSAMLPFSLWWNLWVRLDPPLGLFLRQYWFPLSDVAEVLEERGPQSISRALGSYGAEAETALPPLWEAAERRGTFHFLYRFFAGSLRLILKFGEVQVIPRIRVRIDFGIWAEEITTDVSGSTVSISGTSLPVQAWINRSTVTIEFQFTGAPFETPGCAYVGIAAEENGRVAACTAFPFQLSNGKR